jgi:hypothetical protein
LNPTTDGKRSQSRNTLRQINKSPGHGCRLQISMLSFFKNQFYNNEVYSRLADIIGSKKDLKKEWK